MYRSENWERRIEKKRFCTSRQPKHRRGVTTGGPVVIVMIAGFLPDVTEEIGIRPGLVGDGGWCKGGLVVGLQGGGVRGVRKVMKNCSAQGQAWELYP